MAGMVYRFSALSPADAAGLERWLGNHAGVWSAIADPQAKTLTITFDPMITVEGKLREELEERGFSVVGVEDPTGGDQSPSGPAIGAELATDDRMIASLREAELE